METTTAVQTKRVRLVSDRPRKEIEVEVAPSDTATNLPRQGVVLCSPSGHASRIALRTWPFKRRENAWL